MDARLLAQKMLDWGKLQQEASTLAEEIRAAVLDIGKTQTVGNVRASYSRGRKSYDYQEAADGHIMVGEATVRLFTTIIPETKRVDWKSLCLHSGIEDIPFTQSEPSVKVKLLS